MLRCCFRARPVSSIFRSRNPVGIICQPSSVYKDCMVERQISSWNASGVHNFGGHHQLFPLNFPFSLGQLSFQPSVVPGSTQGSRFKGHAFLSTSTGNISGTKIANEKNATNTAAKGDHVADVKIISTLGKYLWLKDNLEFRLRVLTALGFLVGAKVLNVGVPFLFKHAIDWLSAVTGNADKLASFTPSNAYILAFFVSPAAVLIGYGIARSAASAFNELRTAVFSKVALRTIRSVSRKVFSHLHELDLRFHLWYWMG